jgi:hypothetical protein
MIVRYGVCSKITTVYISVEFHLGKDDDCFLFSRIEHHIDGYHTNLFSVISRTAYPTIKNRVVVEYVGDDVGSGTWKCFKDPTVVGCVHITEARSLLQIYTGCEGQVDLEGEEHRRFRTID